MDDDGDSDADSDGERPLMRPLESVKKEVEDGVLMVSAEKSSEDTSINGSHQATNGNHLSTNSSESSPTKPEGLRTKRQLASSEDESAVTIRDLDSQDTVPNAEHLHGPQNYDGIKIEKQEDNLVESSRGTMSTVTHVSTEVSNSGESNDGDVGPLEENHSNASLEESTSAALKMIRKLKEDRGLRGEATVVCSDPIESTNENIISALVPVLEGGGSDTESSLAFCNDQDHNIVPRDGSRRPASSISPLPRPSLTIARPLSNFYCLDGAVITTSGQALPTNHTDIYESFASIFPAVQGNGTTARTGALDAKALLESLQVQCRLYEDWLLIMQDYATVFSADSVLLPSTGKLSTSSAVYDGGSKALHYRVKSVRADVCNIVSDVFNCSLPDWVELPSGLGLASWNLLWTWSRPKVDLTHLLVWQRYNHFHNSKQLTRKDFLKRNLQRFTDMRCKASESFEIMPLTFLLPHDYNAFIHAFTGIEDSSPKKENIWILKPIGLSRGRGISLVRDISDVTYSQASVLQKYVERPLCLQGYKFDLRLYVCVTSFRPLEVFIYKEGFARVSTQRYSLAADETSNKFIHLTNSSIQKQNVAGPSNDNPVSNNEDGGGSKITLHGPDGLWKRLERTGVNTLQLWRNICILVLKSLVAVNDQIAHQPCAFEVFGYDVLIDQDLRPWLLEVNSSPSMARENKLDSRVKDAMIRDTITLLDVTPFDRTAVLKVFKRRMGSLAKSKFSASKHDPDFEKDLRAMVR